MYSPKFYLWLGVLFLIGVLANIAIRWLGLMGH